MIFGYKRIIITRKYFIYTFFVLFKIMSDLLENLRRSRLFTLLYVSFFVRQNLNEEENNIVCTSALHGP